MIIINPEKKSEMAYNTGNGNKLMSHRLPLMNLYVNMNR